MNQLKFYLWRWTLSWVMILDAIPCILTLGVKNGGSLTMRSCCWAIRQPWYKVVSAKAIGEEDWAK